MSVKTNANFSLRAIQGRYLHRNFDVLQPKRAEKNQTVNTYQNMPNKKSK